MQEQATSSIVASSLPSSSERSSSSALQIEVKEGMESDEEIRRVPEIGGEAFAAPDAGREAGSLDGPDRVQPSGEGGQRKRGRNPADKENKRLKSGIWVIWGLFLPFEKVVEEQSFSTASKGEEKSILE
ncbi:hypothetical protein CRYUN_Cryun33cG0028500 [Craigia yunnanensis]